MYLSGGCQDRSLVISGRLDLLYLWVLQLTGFSEAFGFHRVLASVSLFLENQFLYLSLYMAFLLNLDIAANLLVFKLDMFASFKALKNDKYWSWYIMWRPVFKHLSSILLSFLVIMGPQKATLPSQIDNICCINTSISSELGQPRDFSLLRTHILL